MNARELIVELQKLDPEEELFLYDHNYGVDSVDDVCQLLKTRLVNPNDKWFIV